MNLEKLNNNPGDKQAVREFNDYMVYKTNHRRELISEDRKES
ncbi:MAG: hypothetical protein NUV86_10745 [Candidatus Scalindua sp.]|nr:hypothetical protein [Candidatus Scalindua sp.]MCR4344069.1 hypothetical protein [Candidatus Scalindua sp.]